MQVKGQKQPVGQPMFGKCFRQGLLATGLCTSAVLGLAGCRPSVSSVSTDSELKTISILGQFSPEDAAKFEASLAPFEEKNNIDIVYESADNFSSLLRMRISAFNAPDLAVLPQPGLMADLARDGFLVPLPEVMEMQALRSSYSDDLLSLGTVDDVPYGLWYRISVKSLVWYRPAAFEAKGYDIPQTWNELMALSDRIVADGGTPWCIGLESGAASGWPATDWVEDIVLRQAGPEVYSQWISHQLPFDAPQIVKAVDEFGKLLRKPKYVSGGAAEAADIPYDQSAQGLFSNPPDCYLHRQGNFVSSFFSEDKQPRVDYDAFPLPAIEETFGLPILISGDAVVLLNETPETAALMQYMATPEPHTVWARLGGFISPNQQVPVSAYSDLVTQKVAQILLDADSVRFDASDMMPGSVGTGTFWSGMIDFAKGESAKSVTQDIESSWP